MRTKEELLAALVETRDEVLTRCRGLDLGSGVYEGGWNGHQLLAHLASTEWTYPRVLDLPAATDVLWFVAVDHVRGHLADLTG